MERTDYCTPLDSLARGCALIAMEPNRAGNTAGQAYSYALFFLCLASLALKTVSPVLSPFRLPEVIAGVEGAVVRGVTASPPVCCSDLLAAILFATLRRPRIAGVSVISFRFWSRAPAMPVCCPRGFVRIPTLCWSFLVFISPSLSERPNYIRSCQGSDLADYYISATLTVLSSSPFASSGLRFYNAPNFTSPDVLAGF
jgi:hypothetical protein